MKYPARRCASTELNQNGVATSAPYGNALIFCFDMDRSALVYHVFYSRSKSLRWMHIWLGWNMCNVCIP